MKSISTTTGWRSVVTTLALVTIAGATLVGCAGTWGNVSPSREATDMFHAYTVLPGHRYYYSGPDAHPFAIIGIQNDYELQSKFWKPVDLTPDQLSNWINYPSVRVGYDLNIYGAYLKGPSDETIGVWYSVRDWRSWGTVHMLENNQVAVTTPNLERTQMPFKRIGKLE